MMRVVVTALACAAGAFALTSGLQQRAPLASRPRAIAQQRCQRAAVRGRAAAAPAGAVTMMAGALDEGSVTGTGFAAARAAGVCSREFLEEKSDRTNDLCTSDIKK